MVMVMVRVSVSRCGGSMSRCRSSSGSSGSACSCSTPWRVMAAGGKECRGARFLRKYDGHESSFQARGKPPTLPGS